MICSASRRPLCRAIKSVKSEFFCLQRINATLLLEIVSQIFSFERHSDAANAQSAVAMRMLGRDVAHTDAIASHDLRGFAVRVARCRVECCNNQSLI